MTKSDAINILINFDKQVIAKADGAYQTKKGKDACSIGADAIKKQMLLEKDLKYYLDNNEEDGVVYIPKFIIEKLLN